MYNAGNTDTLVLATVDQAGKLVTLNARELGRGHHGERVVPRQHGGGRRREGRRERPSATVFRHETPTDPDSPLTTTQVGPTLTFAGTLGARTLVGVDATGEVGILAAAVNAANSSSVTNITID